MKHKAVINMNKKELRGYRRAWVLSYFWENYLRGLGVASIRAVPSSTFFGRDPGVDMTTVRGLERHGSIEERCSGLFFLTEFGRLECEVMFRRYKISRKPKAEVKR